MILVQAVGSVLVVAVAISLILSSRKSHRASVAKISHELDVVAGQRDRYLSRLDDLVGGNADQYDYHRVPGNLDDATREVVRWKDNARSALRAFGVVDAQRLAAEERAAGLEAERMEMVGMMAARDASGRETDHEDMAAWRAAQLRASGHDVNLTIKRRSGLSVTSVSSTIEPKAQLREEIFSCGAGPLAADSSRSEMTRDEVEYAVRNGRSYAVCCSQREMDDVVELQAAFYAGFKSAYPYLRFALEARVDELTVERDDLRRRLDAVAVKPQEMDWTVQSSLAAIGASGVEEDQYWSHHRDPDSVYRVIGVVVDEKTLVPGVAYGLTSGGPTWVRSLAEFLGDVECERGCGRTPQCVHECGRVPRFGRVEVADGKVADGPDDGGRHG